ncbi:possible Mox-R protein (methanol dehydrogenase component) [Aurantimonas manganoxydans SI85-9A1]|uniref:Possible Mox-R protein (Methanol dehydrogenase component) n=2 Tax=Aurantimonas manganoxydans TaxID=651183 RepID=Q1YEP4_AURMS|nr:possible Mox-R protein (methanol dehydrogenase component) [Aurantimonas manganoxydans SI85-9A1]
MSAMQDATAVSRDAEPALSNDWPDGGGAHALSALQRAVETGLIGHQPLVERLMIGLLTGGHLLIEGAPGLAKTRAVKRLADGLESPFSRIQCTPDLMPADLTGTQVFRPEKGVFEFVQGPVFHSLVLVDEINRAPPKVQSALLEAMAEGQVTAGGTTYALPDPFMVVATQNSIEHEGTFPLPEAQLDRFLMHVLVDMPDARSELAILDLVEREASGTEAAMPHPVTSAAIVAARQAAAKVHLAPALKDYIVRLVMATREDQPAPDIRKAIEHPVSPRGTLALAASAKARAYLRGRDYAVPEDVSELAPDILAHRIVPTWRAAADGVTARNLVARLVDLVQPL